MLLATMVAATVLAQASGPAPAAPRCIEPPSRWGPPPCAAANVPGCIPGYHRQVDAYGRVRYVCDAYAYDSPEPPYPPAESPPPPSGSPPPPAASPPPPAAPPLARPAPRAPPWYYAPPPRRGQFGIVFMPGVTSTPSDPNTNATGTGAIALELRPQVGGGRLRFGFEASRFGRVAELALKYDFNDGGQVRPFLALAIGGASIDPDPGWRVAASISGGLDLYVSRDFFFSLELKERGFARRSAAAAYGLEPGGLAQTAFFMGVGLYF